MRNLGVVPAVFMKRNKMPSLVDLCVQSAIDNLQHLADIGETDLSLLAKILPHCNAEQLHRIESSSDRRDLSSITDELWRKFYTRKFGTENTNLVLERMKKKKCCFKWRLLYQAKIREQEEVQKKCVDRLKELYKVADIQKQSRQTQFCEKKPPSKKRRTFELGGGSTNQFSHVKGRLMKKSRIDFAASNEVKRMKPQPTSSRFPIHQPPVVPSNQKPFNPTEKPSAFQNAIRSSNRNNEMHLRPGQHLDRTQSMLGKLKKS